MKSNNQIYYLLLFSFCFSINLFGQISIEKFPQDYQIFQRNNQNQANIIVKGSVSDANMAVTLKVILNGNTVFEQSQNGNFSFSAPIEAGRNNYIFKLFQENIEIKKAENVVCGDIFLFYGQSNALGFNGIWNYKGSQDPFLRFYHVFDFNSKNGAWFIPSKTSDREGVGLVGLELQRILLEKHNIPVGIIQAAEGGKAIHELNDRDPNNPQSTGTIYGKLLTKVMMSGGGETVKYMVFRQGETDASGETYSRDYHLNFDKLYKNLNNDLPNLLKFYNFQVNIAPEKNQFAGTLRDFQRRTKSIYPKITTLTNIGTKGFDGVHYSYEGYLQTPQELARIISSEIYNEGGSPQIYSPEIKKAEYSDNKIILEFDEGQQMNYPEDQFIGGTTRKMKDFFEIDGRNDVVESGYSEGNKIILNLKNIQNPKKITYLPSYFSDEFSPFYNGVLLTNSLNMRAFSFENIEIGGSTETPCTKDIVLNSIPETSYIAAGNLIKAMIFVSKSKELTLSAKNAVDLEDGFDSEIGTNFTAEIGGCGNLN